MAARADSTAESTSVKERVLRAAILEFALTGYHQTSLRTIAERSGSNKPMIYYHFRGKDGLYLAAVRLMLEETAALLREAAPADLPALLRLRRYAEVYMDAFLRSRPLLGTVLRELESLPPTLHGAIVDEYMRLVAVQMRRILADGVEQGDFRGLDMDGCISGMIALLHGFVHGRHAAPERTMRVAVSQLMDYYALGLLSREALAARAGVEVREPGAGDTGTAAF